MQLRLLIDAIREHGACHAATNPIGNPVLRCHGLSIEDRHELEERFPQLVTGGGSNGSWQDIEVDVGSETELAYYLDCLKHDIKDLPEGGTFTAPSPGDFLLKHGLAADTPAWMVGPGVAIWSLEQGSKLLAVELDDTEHIIPIVRDAAHFWQDKARDVAVGLKLVIGGGMYGTIWLPNYRGARLQEAVDRTWDLGDDGPIVHKGLQPLNA